MDIFAHALVANASGEAISRKNPIRLHERVWVVLLSVAPDIFHIIPVIIGAMATADTSLIFTYALATPETEPELPVLISKLSCILHCILHSVLTAFVMTGILFLYRRKLVVLTIGWWLHIGLDIFTHSKEYYPVEPLYPLSEWSFDGIAWNEQGVFFATYLGITIVYLTLFLTRKKTPHR